MRAGRLASLTEVARAAVVAWSKMMPNPCDMPASAPRNEAEIYASVRDVMIRAQCDRRRAAHQCCGAITIIRTAISLRCLSCGDLQ